MPTYILHNSKTKKEEEHFLSWNELQDLLSQNPQLSQIPSAPAIVSGVANRRNKPDEGFRDILRRIKKNNRGSKVNVP